MKSRLQLVCLAVLTLLISLPTLAEKVYIDVRTPEEYSADHITGDANIPLATVDAKALAAKYGKDADLVLYCHTGNRAGKAKALLDSAGFTHVTNGGSIGDVRKLRQLPEPQASPAK